MRRTMIAGILTATALITGCGSASDPAQLTCSAGYRVDPGPQGDTITCQYYAATPERVEYGTVPESTWNALLGRGWTGRPGDACECLYAPSQPRETLP